MMKNKTVSKNSYRLRLTVLDEIAEKKLTAKEIMKITGLTYRQINDWDKKGILLSQERGKSNTWSWRKFTGTDAIRLSILTELRKVGIPPIDLREIAMWLKDREMGIIKEIKTEIAKGSNIFLSTNLKNKFMLVSDSRKIPENVLDLAYKGFGANKIIFQVNINNIVNDILKSLGKKPLKIGNK